MEEKPLFNLDDAKKLFSENQDNYQEFSQEESYEEDSEIDTNKTNRLRKLKTIVFWFLVVILAFITGYLIVNGPAFGKKIVYWYNGIFNKEMGSEMVFNPEVKVDPSSQKSNAETLPDNRLVIPKIGVDAPINWDVEENLIQDKLLLGIVHYKTSSLPGKEGGNIFLTGHSSNYWWIKSQFNSVFALLDNLQSGDKIALTYENKKYVYEVYDKFIVKPNQVEVINPIENKTTLTLMSCVPVGTNLRRLIIRSNLLYVDTGNEQKQNTGSETPNNTNTSNSSGEQPVNISDTNTSQPSETEGSKNQNSDFYLPST